MVSELKSGTLIFGSEIAIGECRGGAFYKQLFISFNKQNEAEGVI